MSNPALNLAPCSRWTLRDKAAQRPWAWTLGIFTGELHDDQSNSRKFSIDFIF